MPLVERLHFKQFRMGQDNPKLIVQLVEQVTQVGIRFHHVRTGMLSKQGHIHAWGPAVVAALGTMSRAGAASRHSVSAKMRIDPPAVRTYSTLPADIQL